MNIYLLAYLSFGLGVQASVSVFFGASFFKGLLWVPVWPFTLGMTAYGKKKGKIVIKGRIN